jgi:hypothetical protein
MRLRTARVLVGKLEENVLTVPNKVSICEGTSHKYNSSNVWYDIRILNRQLVNVGAVV